MSESETGIDQPTLTVLHALMKGYAQMAHTISQVLAQESLAHEERSRLQVLLSAGVLTTAKQINDVVPGGADDLIAIAGGMQDIDEDD